MLPNGNKKKMLIVMIYVSVSEQSQQSPGLEMLFVTIQVHLNWA